MNHIERGQDYVMHYFSVGNNLNLCLDLARIAHKLGSHFKNIYLDRCTNMLNTSNSMDVLKMALDISHAETMKQVIYTIMQDFEGFNKCLCFDSKASEFQRALRMILDFH